MPPDHWTDELFVRHEEIFRAVHEHAWTYGVEQAQHLARIVERFGIGSGARVLDAPCGIGRHATRLARLGYHVVGVDLSPAYVERARELAAQEGVGERATYAVGDLRSLRSAIPEGETPFDVAMNLWTSIGYYDEETDGKILQEYAALVRPGGILLLETINRDFLVRHFNPQGREVFGDLVQIEQRRLDLSASRMRNEWRFFRQHEEDLEHVATIPIDHRVYGLHELRALLEQAGWHVEATFGGLKLDPPSFDAPRLLVVGRK